MVDKSHKIFDNITPSLSVPKFNDIEFAKSMIKKKSILELSNESLIDAKKRIKYLMTKNEALEESVKQMRKGYMKELSNYKEQLFRHEKYPDTFEPIKATYFSALEVLDEDLRNLLNQKLDYTTDDFNDKILRMQKTNEYLVDKIRKFEQL